ncbi:hypothetical protein WJ0W_003596 [Paenibacillus melissococcoides]|uniref:YkoP-like domain-containing protein n=1 Tax=Paenibacillus melissococcoides TaxID=2912268 RepID=A0ABN8U5J5_9BACL|nr:MULTISPECIES: hypothetical protein [Paenibacillus]MEB9895609.1 hypothetical protein [Bacillus cereus]CAH8246361.1 hypothetical protein WJ0W_003596 [Paenibacillus melissococcoides]CAH8714514.1 hypothetical protein HTL2_003968 [Paenibacillus melissococcoides]CAH8715470.1 hypothetical protein WDD9_004235 [Paenibacillus melissococcoides]GIO78186.1 hypothetical protein J6TS7_17960 [Paenibacillus dendritiformis]
MWFKSFALSIWSVIDPVYYACTRLKCIEHEDGSTFRVRLTSFRGGDVLLSDGTIIKRGDILLKIHLHNVMLLKNMLSIKSEIKKGKLLYRLIEKSLPDLAEYVRNHPKHDDIKGIIGITMLNRGGSGLGFETIQIRSVMYKWIKYVTMMPIYFVSANDPLRNLKKQTPAYLFMSKNVLMNKYGTKSLPNLHHGPKLL